MSVDRFLLSANTTDLNYPEIRPTLDLNFARVKALDSRITFARSSGGSYVGADGFIKYAGVNEARFDHNPTTGESLGLLVEEARTNLMLRSEEFDDASWTKTASSVTANAVAAPNGTVTADTLIEDTSTGTHTISRSATALISTIYTFSVYAKAASGVRSLRLFIPATIFGTNGTALFDIQAGTTGNITGTVASSNIVALANGWYRCSVTTAASAAAATANFTIQLTSGGVVSYTGDGTSGIYLWGAQLEAGAFPTSYIPTQGLTRTRAADNASITGINFSEWYKQTEGTFFGEVFPAPTYVAFQAVATLQGATGADEWRMWRTNTNIQNSSMILNNSTAGLSINIVYATTSNGSYKFATAAAANNMATASSGNLTSDNAGAMVPMTSLRIGARTNNTFYYNGHISRLTYWPKILSNAQLQALTK